METTFISIHDLSLDARLLYVSNSIVDILGYTPEEVVGKSCWEYFHPDEIPFARAIHGRGVQLDKAAVLNYCQIKSKHGLWIGCECVFTIVHDVLVASTSIYRRGLKSQKRAVDAPIIRQLFSSSPRDPRYHMLSYISSKFTQEPKPHSHEPRAALFLNRFTRTLTIMYATNGLADVLGVSADELSGKSFYFCIQQNCLPEAIRCLESAKANDSIAYLRFWFRNPCQDDQSDHDEPMSDAHHSEEDEDEDDGGVHLNGHSGHYGKEHAISSSSSQSGNSSSADHSHSLHPSQSIGSPSRSSSDNSAQFSANAHEAIFDHPEAALSSQSSLPSDDGNGEGRDRYLQTPVELEAVVSCTSDGLVVTLRRARPFVPPSIQLTRHTTQHPYANGLFASPWAVEPVMPTHQGSGFGQTNLGDAPLQTTATPANGQPLAGSATEYFMNSIREVAVFAWSLTGINGSLAQYGRGKPTGESQPPDGLQVWDPNDDANREVEMRDQKDHTNNMEGVRHNGL